MNDSSLIDFARSCTGCLRARGVPAYLALSGPVFARVYECRASWFHCAGIKWFNRLSCSRVEPHSEHSGQYDDTRAAKPCIRSIRSACTPRTLPFYQLHYRAQCPLTKHTSDPSICALLRFLFFAHDSERLALLHNQDLLLCGGDHKLPLDPACDKKVI